MRYCLAYFFSVLIIIGQFQTSYASEDSCVCAKLSCRAECEVEQDLTFYSEKCDGGKRVKSCAKPTCIPVQNAPAFCGGKTTDVSQSTDGNRAPASVQSQVAPLQVGQIEFVEGVVKRRMVSKDYEPVDVGADVFEGDQFETDSKGKVRIKFKNGNIVNIMPSSTMAITEMQETQKNSKRVILDLLKGKVRSKVKETYKDGESYYKVRTSAAVAGVRGTDFVVSAEIQDKNFVSKIETFDGRVELGDHKLIEKTTIAPGETASYIKLAEFVSDPQIHGYLTPIQKMGSDYLANLNNETDFKIGEPSQLQAKNANIKSHDLAICSAPKGELNECSWTCENNPSGEKNCRTDLKEVRCIRRVCNANGVWTQPMRMPSSYRDHCSGEQPVVKKCDY